MLKIKTLDDRVQVVRLHPDAPAGHKHEVVGSFPGSSKQFPGHILAKLSVDDLRWLIGAVPVSTWAAKKAVKSNPRGKPAAKASGKASPAGRTSAKAAPKRSR